MQRPDYDPLFCQIFSTLDGDGTKVLRFVSNVFFLFPRIVCAAYLWVCVLAPVTQLRVTPVDGVEPFLAALHGTDTKIPGFAGFFLFTDKASPVLCVAVSTTHAPSPPIAVLVAKQKKKGP